MATYSTIRDLQARASRLIADARGGEPLIITNHGKPVAVLAAVDPAQADDLACAIERMQSYRAFKSLQARLATRAKQPDPKDIEAIVRRGRRAR